MSAWTASTLAVFATVEEVRIVTQRQDGSLRRPRIIWVVALSDRLFIRSVNGRDADWFRWAIATGTGQLEASGTAYDVTFTEAQEGDLDAVDAAYQGKYGRRYASIVRDLCRPVPRAATLQVHLA